MSNFDRSITIGHRWFDTIKKDYTDWVFAWAREAGQNSLDAGATRIDIQTALANGDTVVRWSDNGCGMNADILESKFMAIGGSEKPDGGTGGFGIAKLILAFAQKSYSIRSQDILIEGQGASYSIETNLPYIKGLTLTAVMEGKDTLVDIEKHIRQWSRFTTTSCEIYLNNELLKTLRMGPPKKETTWCKVYTNKAPDNDDKYWGYYIRVRINQQYMFRIYTSVDAHITVDLLGHNSADYLTSNRDGMNWTWRSKLEKLVEEIYDNPNAIKNAPSHVTLYRGRNGVVALRTKEKTGSGRVSLAGPSKVAALSSKYRNPDQSWPITAPREESFIESEKLNDGFDVLVVNQTTSKIPERFLPGSMPLKTYKILNRWTQILQVCGAILGRTEEVRVGWVFSQSARAMYKKDMDYGHMLLVNPVEIGKTRLTNYWRPDKRSFYEMVAAAVHELTHIDNLNHNEDFAASITYGLAQVMAELPKLEAVRKATK